MAEKKRKRINWVLINEENEPSVHRVLSRERKRDHHKDSQDAEIAVLWMLNQKADVDGRVHRVKVAKCGESDTALHDFDFKIGVNREWWDEATDDAKAFELDNAMCEIQPSFDADGEQKVDEDDRPCWRKRKPDFSGFEDPVKTHGPQSPELASAGRVMAAAQTTLPFVSAPEVADEAAPN